MEYQDSNEVQLVDPYLKPKQPSGKKKVMFKRNIDNSNGKMVNLHEPSQEVSQASMSEIDKNTEHTQIVENVEAGNALVHKLRQLEAENVSLTKALAKICDENSSLTNSILSLEKKCADLSEGVLKDTPILHSLFAPEKTGWFGGSKSAARESLEKLLESLQKEFTEYKATHSSSVDEVRALLTEVQNANNNTADMAKIVHEQQQALSHEPFSVKVRVLACSESDRGVEGAIVNELRSEVSRLQGKMRELLNQQKSLQDDVKAKSNEASRLQNELMETRQGAAAASLNSTSNGPLWAEIELQKAKDQNQRYEEEIKSLQEALAKEERLHAVKSGENSNLLENIKSLENQCKDHLKEIAEMRAEKNCTRCGILESDIEQMKKESKEADTELASSRRQLSEMASSFEAERASLGVQIAEKDRLIADYESKLRSSSWTAEIAQLEQINKATMRELELYRQQVSRLEQMIQSQKEPLPGSGSQDNSSHLGAAPHSDQEQVRRLEFEKEHLLIKMKSMHDIVLKCEEDSQRSVRQASEDKQRISFLVKKCATLTADLRAVTSARDELHDKLEEASLELKRLRRQNEEIVPLQQKYDALRKEKEQMEVRLGGIAELEEKLVTAKETIAYMELAQSQTINMSQYAELQSEKAKLEHGLAPLKKKLEDASKEVTRLSSEAEGHHLVMLDQKQKISGLEEKVVSLVATEAKLREKVASFGSENDRLQQLNTSLEEQMHNMQDGIKEMAMKMEKERENAKINAGSTYKKEIEDLKSQLATAQQTLANIRANGGQFVPEGIHKALVAEKDKLSEEMLKRNFELEKLKSEILIYRQTITDLETESEEHIKEIEKLQERLKTDRTNLSEKLSVEQHRSAELAENLHRVQESLSKALDNAKEDADKITKMEATSQKNQRAFEDKCRKEEKLNAEIESLKKLLQATKPDESIHAIAAGDSTRNHPNEDRSTSALPMVLKDTSPISIQKKDLGPNASTSLPSRDPNHGSFPNASSIGNRSSHVEDVLNAIRSKIPSELRAVFDNEMDILSALKASNAALILENEHLKKTAASASSSPVLNMYNPVVTPSIPNDFQNWHEERIELQRRIRDLEEESSNSRETLQRELEKMGETAANYAKQLTEAEKKLNEFVSQQKNDLDPALAASGNDPLGGEHKKKKKKKKRLSVVAMMDMEDEDVLLPVALPEPSESHSEAKDNHELALLQEENESLKEQIANLQADLDNAHEDLDLANHSIAQEKEKLKKQIKLLEDKVKTTNSGSRSPDMNEMIEELESQLKMHQNEKNKIQSELDSLKQKLRETDSGTSGAVGSKEIKRLRKQIKELEQEISLLSAEVLPNKNKLIEYMALTDRLGIKYPFTAEMEKAASNILSSLPLNSQPPAKTPSRRASHARLPSGRATSPEHYQRDSTFFYDYNEAEVPEEEDVSLRMPNLPVQESPCFVESTLWRECLKQFDYGPDRPKGACEKQRVRYYDCIKDWTEKTQPKAYDYKKFQLVKECAPEAEKLHQCMMIGMFEVSRCEDAMNALKRCGAKNDPSIRKALEDDPTFVYTENIDEAKGWKRLWYRAIGKL